LRRRKTGRAQSDSEQYLKLHIHLPIGFVFIKDLMEYNGDREKLRILFNLVEAEYLKFEEAKK